MKIGNFEYGLSWSILNRKRLIQQQKHDLQFFNYYFKIMISNSQPKHLIEQDDSYCNSSMEIIPLQLAHTRTYSRSLDVYPQKSFTLLRHIKDHSKLYCEPFMMNFDMNNHYLILRWLCQQQSQRLSYQQHQVLLYHLSHRIQDSNVVEFQVVMQRGHILDQHDIIQLSVKPFLQFIQNIIKDADYLQICGIYYYQFSLNNLIKVNAAYKIIDFDMAFFLPSDRSSHQFKKILFQSNIHDPMQVLLEKYFSLNEGNQIKTEIKYYLDCLPGQSKLRWQIEKQLRQCSLSSQQTCEQYLKRVQNYAQKFFYKKELSKFLINIIKLYQQNIQLNHQSDINEINWFMQQLQLFSNLENDFTLTNLADSLHQKLNSIPQDQIEEEIDQKQQKYFKKKKGKMQYAKNQNNHNQYILKYMLLQQPEQVEEMLEEDDHYQQLLNDQFQNIDLQTIIIEQDNDKSHSHQKVNCLKYFWQDSEKKTTQLCCYKCIEDQLFGQKKVFCNKHKEQIAYLLGYQQYLCQLCLQSNFDFRDKIRKIKKENKQPLEYLCFQDQCMHDFPNLFCFSEIQSLHKNHQTIKIYQNQSLRSQSFSQYLQSYLEPKFKCKSNSSAPDEQQVPFSSKNIFIGALKKIQEEFKRIYTKIDNTFEALEINNSKSKITSLKHKMLDQISIFCTSKQKSPAKFQQTVKECLGPVETFAELKLSQYDADDMSSIAEYLHAQLYQSACTEIEQIVSKVKSIGAHLDRVCSSQKLLQNADDWLNSKYKYIYNDHKVNQPCRLEIIPKYNRKRVKKVVIDKTKEQMWSVRRVEMMKCQNSYNQMKLKRQIRQIDEEQAKNLVNSKSFKARRQQEQRKVIQQYKQWQQAIKQRYKNLFILEEMLLLSEIEEISIKYSQQCHSFYALIDRYALELSEKQLFTVLQSLPKLILISINGVSLELTSKQLRRFNQHHLSAMKQQQWLSCLASSSFYEINSYNSCSTLLRLFSKLSLQGLSISLTQKWLKQSSSQQLYKLLQMHITKLKYLQQQYVFFSRGSNNRASENTTSEAMNNFSKQFNSGVLYKCLQIKPYLTQLTEINLSRIEFEQPQSKICLVSLIENNKCLSSFSLFYCHSVPVACFVRLPFLIKNISIDHCDFATSRGGSTTLAASNILSNTNLITLFIDQSIHGQNTENFAPLLQLQHLHLWSCPWINYERMASLSQHVILNITQLTLHGCQNVSDDCLSIIANMHQLTYLDLSSIMANVGKIADFSTNCLNFLRLFRCACLSDAKLVAILQRHRYLIEINLSYNVQIGIVKEVECDGKVMTASQYLMKHANTLMHLSKINVCGTRITDHCKDVLRQHGIEVFDQN